MAGCLHSAVLLISTPVCFPRRAVLGGVVVLELPLLHHLNPLAGGGEISSLLPVALIKGIMIALLDVTWNSTCC